ncbi:UvrD-helicase domain-containing protein [Geomicrobium sp. JCM 19055]|uniref:UvrD-helicase domain-containing protein n=1 Tax=Geomicrobium sp. JCM 19055 TaxID=1460649 RepID=UPI00045ED99D|nr:UvrD-helicase domain-containing protein [Geomicrobium sp. JCM 19055]GAK00756.1 putative ATP-dependent DNA helicase YjcD [Geomicrobium sp. JCM 19055]
MDYFKQMEHSTGVLLNDIQKQAVLKTDGPLLLLASPGSGKTTTLNMKIGYLLLEKKSAA